MAAPFGRMKIYWPVINCCGLAGCRNMPRNEWLHEMNPSLKFILLACSMFAMAFFFNPLTPSIFFIGVVLIQLLFSRINWKAWSLFMIPISFTAIGYLWTTVVFSAEQAGPVIFSWHGFVVTEAQWHTALSLAFRVFAFASLSMLFAFTTDPVRFVMSLMQQLKLPPKLAYGVMVGYQFLPIIKDEFIQTRHAHRLRGIGEEKNLLKRLIGLRKLLMPLLAGAVRSAERSAFAMEARGFTGERRSVYFEPITVNRLDWLLCLLLIALLVASCIGGSILS